MLANTSSMFRSNFLHRRQIFFWRPVPRYRRSSLSPAILFAFIYLPSLINANLWKSLQRFGMFAFTLILVLTSLCVTSADSACLS